MNRYKVTHHHDRIFKGTREEDNFTLIYSINAKNPKDAAVIAHCLYNGYALSQATDRTPKPFRTVYEKYADEITESPVGKNTEECSVFLYDGISGHVIIVDRLD